MPDQPPRRSRARSRTAPRGIGRAFGASGSGSERAPRRTPLDLASIVGAAVEILDLEGAAGLTFRRLAQQLEVGVASLYWYVESKAVLLDLALDHVLGDVAQRLTTGDPAAATAAATDSATDRTTGADGPPDWQAVLRSGGLALYGTFLEHRWAPAQLILSADRGPNLLLLWERVGGVMIGAGFTQQQSFDGISLLMNHVLASGVQEATWDPTGAMSATDRREALREIGGFLRGLDPAIYPHVVASADVFQGHDNAVQFADGLDIILDGLALRLGR